MVRGCGQASRSFAINTARRAIPPRGLRTVTARSARGRGANQRPRHGSRHPHGPLTAIPLVRGRVRVLGTHTLGHLLPRLRRRGPRPWTGSRRSPRRRSHRRSPRRRPSLRRATAIDPPDPVEVKPTRGQQGRRPSQPVGSASSSRMIFAWRSDHSLFGFSRFSAPTARSGDHMQQWGLCRRSTATS